MRSWQSSNCWWCLCLLFCLYFITARSSYASAVLGIVILSVCRPVCPSHGCFITKSVSAVFCLLAFFHHQCELKWTRSAIKPVQMSSISVSFSTYRSNSFTHPICKQVSEWLLHKTILAAVRATEGIWCEFMPTHAASWIWPICWKIKHWCLTFKQVFIAKRVHFSSNS